MQQYVLLAAKGQFSRCLGFGLLWFGDGEADAMLPVFGRYAASKPMDGVEFDAAGLSIDRIRDATKYGAPGMIWALWMFRKDSTV